MTAIVGILNKRGIAIASDSAVTFTNAIQEVAIQNKNEKVISIKDKVVNSGDKMLRLKDNQPVAVMIVGNSLLTKLPWDVIVRWYRKQNDSSGFPKLEDYVQQFKVFVDSEIIASHIKNDVVLKENERTFLVFAGYGEDEAYPSIYQYEVTGIKKSKLQWQLSESTNISDEQESNIFKSGQFDIIDAIELGIQNERIGVIRKRFQTLIEDLLTQNLLDSLIGKIDYPGIRQEVADLIRESGKEHLRQHLEAIKQFDLQKMACLAENLIKATELHRKITFRQEGVGGLVDLAVITREDGFQWLNRKSWYEPSKGGQYGKFGI
jgi:hypothetical protein